MIKFDHYNHTGKVFPFSIRLFKFTQNILRSQIKRVITYGTFDLLHYGHINLLRRAKEYGDYLIVGLSTDEFNAEKGKKSYFDFEKRKKLLEAIRYVDLVIPENNWEQKASRYA